VIPIRRTQVALIESGAVSRLFGWYKLSFQTLGADRKDGGVQVAAPFARMAEILPILAVAGFPEPPPRADFHGVPRRALVRQAVPALALAALATIAAFTVDLRAGILAAALLALAIFGVMRWRKHAHALGERALFVASGLLRRRLWIVPYEKTQAIRVSGGPIQRPLRLASLLLDTAGSGSLRSPEMHDLDEAEAEAMADRLYVLFLAARARIRSA
jgi:putative membrane protein